MNIFFDLANLKKYRNGRRTAVTIGNFDGCHIGHQALCSALTSKLTGTHDIPLALTFDPHPAQVLGHSQTMYRLQRPLERFSTLGRYGVDAVAVVGFTKDTAALSPLDFVKTHLVDASGARYVAIGSDFRFGQGRSGTVEDLKTFGMKFDFEVEALSPVQSKGEIVSSTLVRKCLTERGDLPRARELLGRPWTFTGEVVHGQKLGRQLGFPTANIDTGNLVIPRVGVYVGWAEILESPTALAETLILQSTKIGMVMNVGTRPTVSGGSTDKKVEVHLFGEQNYDLYGRTLRIEPELFLRDERKFPNLETLTAQMRIDVQQAKTFLNLR